MICKCVKVVCLLLYMSFLKAYGQTELLEFSDLKFKEAVLHHKPLIDLNNNGEIEFVEAEKVACLDISNSSISNMSDIKYFKNLIALKCRSNKIEHIDLIEHIYLDTLICDSNQIMRLNLLHNKKLTYLSCSNNKLTNLDLNTLKSLRTINCSNNSLEKLKIKKIKKLKTLNFNNNSLDKIQLPNQIVSLFCDKNNLKRLNLKSNKLISSLSCQNNQLKRLKYNPNNGYIILNLYGNPFVVPPENYKIRKWR